MIAAWVQKEWWTGAATLMLLAAVATYLHSVTFDPSAPALGNNTVSVLDSRVAGKAARDNQRPIAEVLADLPTRGDGRYPIVWIGNSHQHAINDIKPGDELSSVVLHKELNGNVWPGARPVFGISIPNLHFQEQLVLTVALALMEPDHRPRLIIHGVRFHDARELGVRHDLRTLLTTPEFAKWLKSVEEAGRYPALVDSIKEDVALANTEKQRDKGAESWLMDNVADRLPILERRGLIYGNTLNALHQLRDRVFMIDTKSKRPILAGRYKLAIDSLELALAVAKEAGIAVLLYNVPIRPGVESPYVPAQYNQFRDDLKRIAAQYGARFADYDGLIPSKLWGTWYDTDYPDYSHFTGEGHRILAAQVGRDIARYIGAH